MGLKKAAGSIPPRQDPADAIVVFEGEPLKFARPRVADIQPTSEQLQQIARNYPGLRPDQIYQIHILGTGYIPEPGEGQVSAWKEFAQIAVANDLLFTDLCKQWEAAFPEFSDWASARLSAKNDSGAQVDSDTGLPTSPPDSINSQETSESLT